MKRTILGIFFILLFIFTSKAQSDLSEKNYGPSRGRIPRSYATQIDDNIGNLNTAKFYANKAIGYFLDDNCPLPKNLAGSFKDEKGNDAASMYRANEGCNTLMLSLFRLYLAYPNDAECQSYLDRVIRFANCMLQYGTDRYGTVHSPLLASILIRGEQPYVPTDPENSNQGVRIELRDVWSYSDSKTINNYCAIGVGNIWYDSDESHKASWRGADVEVCSDLYSLFYQMSWALDVDTYPDRAKYKKAADASLAFWVNSCQTESNLYPWGEHGGWDFFRDRYNNDYYHAPLHEYKGNFRPNLDKLIENQSRARIGEMTHFEKYAASLRATHTADADKGARYNGYVLEGIFLFCRHGTLWTDRQTARTQEDYDHDVSKSFGCFPKHIGSYLYIMALAYNRSHDEQVRDSIAINMNYFLDGIEMQRKVYADGKYYPYGTFSWKGYPTQLKNDQNYDLGTFAKRASYLMDGLDNDIKEKLLVVAQNTGVSLLYGENIYPGPEQASITFPQEGYTVYKNQLANLKWDASHKASSYRVYFSDNERAVAQATADSAAFVSETTNPEYQLSGLLPNKQYYWAIDALNDNGDITKGYVMKFLTSDAEPVSVQSLSLDKENSVVDVYQGLLLTPSFYPDNTSNKFVIWSSSDTTKAIVDKKGNVTTKLPGRVTIQATSVDANVSASCELVINQLAQSVNIEPISTKYLPADELLKLEATSSSSLPVSYQVVSGPAILQQQIEVYPVESAYINGTSMLSQDLLRLKVGGMNDLFKIDLSGIDLSGIENAFFEYTTVVDGHRRNYDVDVNMIEYDYNWVAGGAVPAPISSASISDTIIQSKIQTEDAFENTSEYLKAYQKPLRLDVSTFVMNKLSTNNLNFCIALKSTKKSTSDGDDYVRVGSSSHPDNSVRARLILLRSGQGNVLKLTGAGTIVLKVSQDGNVIYSPAGAVTTTFDVIDNGLSINRNEIKSLAKIYPNPFRTGDLNISMEGLDPVKVEIYNTTGIKVFSKQLSSEQSLTLPRTLFANGIYIVSITTKNGIFSYKLVVE